MLKKNVAEGIHCVEDSNVNWFIVEGTEGLTIIDAGSRRRGHPCSRRYRSWAGSPRKSRPCS